MRAGWRGKGVMLALCLCIGLFQSAHAGKAISVDRIVAAAEQRHRAQVVKVEETSVKGRRVYVLRLMSKEGRVWNIRVDAETGGEL